jgi:hypothetical protein
VAQPTELQVLVTKSDLFCECLIARVDAQLDGEAQESGNLLIVGQDPVLAEQANERHE